MRPLIATVLAAAAGLVAAADDPKPADIPALIKQLGSPDFAEREEASRKLGRMPPALEALRAAAEEAPDPEVRARAGKAARAIVVGLGRDRLKQLPDYVKSRQLDRMIEVLVGCREAVSSEDREQLRAAIADILGWVNKEFGPGVPKCEVPKLLLDGPPAFRTRLVTGRTLTRLRADSIAESVDTTDEGGMGFLVNGGGFVYMDNHPWGIVSLVDGDLAVTPRRLKTVSGLVVCNGDFRATQYVTLRDAILICTGSVTLDFVVRNSLIVAGGEINWVRKEFEKYALQNQSVLRPKEKKLAEFFRCYDAAAEGLSVRVADKALVVTQADPAKPFGKAGVRVGDRVIRVNGIPVSDLRGLNKQLCRAEVGYPGPAVLAVARGDEVLELSVKLAD